MKAKEFIPQSKPRNFVAKNQKTAGAGAHKDKKRAEKQGDVKHKKQTVPTEGVEEGLGKTIKRSIAGWGSFDKDKPKDVVNRVKSQDTDVLKRLHDPNTKKGKGSPAELQQKAIGRELKKREQGVAEDAVADFLARGGEIQHGKFRKPRKSEKTDYGSKHIGGQRDAVAGKAGKTLGKAAATNFKGGGKPVVGPTYRSESVAEGWDDEDEVDKITLVKSLQWPELVNKVNSAMKAMGWKGQRKDDGSFMFSTRGQLDDEWYIVVIDNRGNNMFTYALGTVEEGDPHIGDQESLPMTEASVSELMIAVREGFGLGEASVSEVSKATIDRYVTKASDAHGDADFKARMSKHDPDKRSYHVDQKKTAEKRRQGISRALDRMSKNEDVAEARQSAAVKLAKAWDQQKAKSTASRERAKELLNPAKKDQEKKNG